MMGYGFAEIVNRIIKYLIEGLVIAAAAIFIPKKALPLDEVATLAVLAAVVFAILDAVSPSIGVTARQGAGFGLGANLVGFPVLGLVLGPILGENLHWRKVAERKRAYIKASWLWVGLFLSRLIVQYPLYKTGNLTALGTARLAMGYPLFAAVAWGSWLIIKKVPAAIPPEKNKD